MNEQFLARILCFSLLQNASVMPALPFLNSSLHSVELGRSEYCPLFLLGYLLALEIALGKPTASLIATQKLSDAKLIANLISSKTFRPYLSNDIIGAQICGAMKNIYAIGCGIIVGKNFGENAVASVISRSFAEMKSVGKKLDAHPETLSGLSGLGDLFLTCSSKKSRNFSLGFDLAKGKKLENILRSKKTIAEGAYTVRAIKKLGVKLKLSLPLNDACLLYTSPSPRD